MKLLLVMSVVVAAGGGCRGKQACTQGVSQACSHDAMPTAASCERITDASGVTACLGQTVTLVGVVVHSKVPTLLGVDVEAAAALGTAEASATGRLEQYTIAAPTPGEPIAASRSPGTYVRLANADGPGLAIARASTPQP